MPKRLSRHLILLLTLLLIADLFNLTQQTEENEDDLSAKKKKTSSHSKTSSSKKSSKKSVKKINVNQCGRENKGFGRIVGGKNSYPNQFPWMVRLKPVKHPTHPLLCGGVIVARQWVATAAHCIVDKDWRRTDVVVCAGGHWIWKNLVNEQKIPARWSIVHEDYNHVNYNNDIALIYLAKPLEFNENVSAICFLDSNAVFKEIIKKNDCVTAGWGSHKPKNEKPEVSVNLKFVSSSIQNDKVCKKHDEEYIASTMICAYGYGGYTCKGDSGGPLACRDKRGYFHLIGIDSTGFCDREEPTSYTRISAFRDWINDKIH